MKKILCSRRGVTLIETVVSTAIIAIILITVISSMLYGQKMIVFSDSKNNQASQAQELIDDIMTSLSKEIDPVAVEESLDATNVINNTGEKFVYDANNPKQYYYMEKIYPADSGNSSEAVSGYYIKVRVYFNNGDSHVDLQAFTKKSGSGDAV